MIKDLSFDKDIDNKNYERKMSKSQHKDRDMDPEYEGIEKDINQINKELKKQSTTVSKDGGSPKRNTIGAS